MHRKIHSSKLRIAACLHLRMILSVLVSIDSCSTSHDNTLRVQGYAHVGLGRIEKSGSLAVRVACSLE